MDSIRKWNEILRYERESHHWSQQQVANALGTDAKKISAYERGKTKPGYRYRAKLCKLYHKTAEELGFISQEFGDQDLDDDPQDEHIEASDSPQEERVAVLATENDAPKSNQLIQLEIPDSLVHSFSPIHITVSSSPLSAHVVDSPLRNRETTVPVHEEEQDSVYCQQDAPKPPLTTTPELDDTVDRRDFIREAFRVGSTTALASSLDLLSSGLLERFFRAIEKPSTIDEVTLHYLHRRTDGYWHDRNDAVLPASDLLSYVLEDYEKVIELLESPLLPSVRAHLCSIAGGMALLAGTLFYDMSSYARARGYYTSAIRAAQEAHNPALQSVVWAWKSFTWTHSGDLPKALRCIQEARRLSARRVNLIVHGWLAAVEAEIQAKLGQLDTCLVALGGAEHVEEQTHLLEDSYWIHFDASQLASYRGVCRLEVCRSGAVLGASQKASLLIEAHKASTEAVTQLDPALTHRRPIYLSTLAGVFVHQREIEEACRHMIQALAILAQMRSRTVLRRLLTLRQELEPWEDTPCVEHLDRHLVPLLASTWYRGNR